MAHDDNIVAFKPARTQSSPDGSARHLVSECRKVAGRALPKLLDSLFEKLDDALYELADKSETNQLQTAYFDAMRVVRLHRPRMQSEFIDGVLAGYDRFWAPDTATAASHPTPESTPEALDADLALVDDRELEETLAVGNLVSKGENRYHRELFALNRRLSVLAGREEVTNADNPLGPAALCNRFHEVNHLVGVDIPVRLVIYKLFDKHVMNYVGGLYEEINSLLSHAGIAARPVERVRVRPARPRPGSDAPAPPPGTSAPPAGGWWPQPGQGAPYSLPGGAHPPGGGYGTPAGHHAGDVPPSAHQEYGENASEFQGGLFHTLQELLVDYRVSQGRPGAEAPSGMPVVATPELLGVLSALQKAALAYAPADIHQEPLPDLRSRLSDRLKLEQDGDPARTLDKADDDTLDVISLLFERILEDPNLPDPMKVLIARLQIPMLKVAIMDKSFFSRKLHPARRLLNSLARAALGWSDEGDRSENSLYARIESIINRVVTGFEDDPSLFEQLSEEFDAYLEREQRGAEIAEERTNQVVRGKEQLRVAKERVTTEIRQRLEGNPHIPLVVRELLEEAWKDVLLLTFLRQGDQSDAWHQGLALSDRLLWSVQPKNSYDDRQELLRAIPDLLHDLREGFNGISFDQNRSARLFKELQACHIACLRGAEVRVPEQVPPPEAAPAARLEAVDTREERVSLSADKDAPLRHDRFTNMAEELTMGAWLELKEDDGRRVRIKLSWKSDVTDVFVFVNRKGVKVLEMTLAGVAKLLREDRAQVLRDVNVPLMDRALDAMLQTLRNPQAARG